MGEGEAGGSMCAPSVLVVNLTFIWNISVWENSLNWTVFLSGTCCCVVAWTGCPSCSTWTPLTTLWCRSFTTMQSTYILFLWLPVCSHAFPYPWHDVDWQGRLQVLLHCATTATRFMQPFRILIPPSTLLVFRPAHFLCNKLPAEVCSCATSFLQRCVYMDTLATPTRFKFRLHSSVMCWIVPSVMGVAKPHFSHCKKQLTLACSQI